jgi:hypothetical protein
MPDCPGLDCGIGTAFATIVAALAVNREVQRRREEQAAEFSHQARRVLCWPAVAELSKYDARAMPGSSLNLPWVIIRNGSEEPVDFKAQVEVDPAVLEGTKDAARRSLTVEEPIVPPGDMERTVYLPTRVRTSARCRWCSPTPTARDGCGTQTGKLSQVADPLEEAGSMPRVGCGVLWHGPPGQRHEPARLSRGPAHG